MLGGVIADATGDTRFALVTIWIFGVLVLPVAWSLNLRRQAAPT
jgi:CP family cyanate transporter-like MFS transporter